MHEVLVEGETLFTLENTGLSDTNVHSFSQMSSASRSSAASLSRDAKDQQERSRLATTESNWLAKDLEEISGMLFPDSETTAQMLEPPAYSRYNEMDLKPLDSASSCKSSFYSIIANHIIQRHIASYRNNCERWISFSK